MFNKTTVWITKIYGGVTLALVAILIATAVIGSLLVGSMCITMSILDGGMDCVFKIE